VILGPHRVFWNGWETTTNRLASAGWELTAHQDYGMYPRVVLAMRHPCGLILEAEGEREGRIDNSPYVVFMFSVRKVVNERDTFIRHPASSFSSNFMPVDGRPAFASIEEIMANEWYAFKPFEQKAQEIIVEPQSVQQILDELLRRQEPVQAEIRKRIARDDPVIQHAKILSFGT